MELLREFPMLIVAGDIDNLATEDEQAVEFFVQNVPQTRSKVLLTSRRQIFGLGNCTTKVTTMSEEEVGEFVVRRILSLGIDRSKVGPPLLRRIREYNDGSPLYIEDLHRLAQFYSLEGGL